jgi:hypothetical protein
VGVLIDEFEIVQAPASPARQGAEPKPERPGEGSTLSPADIRPLIERQAARRTRLAAH